MKVSKCKFCENLLFEKKVSRSLNSWNKSQNSPKVNHAYSVALVVHSWVGSKRNASRLVNYRHRGNGYSLKFCPECGRQLRKTKEKK